MPLVWDNGDESHAGLVVGGPYTRCVRVMSDIYSDENYAQVWNPDTKRVDEVHIGGAFELNTRRAQVVVDATPEVLEAMAKQREEASAVSAKAAAAAEVVAAKAEVLAPRKGRTVQVVGGRKVPRGTKGVMFWQNDAKSPTRIGMKDANDTTHWVDIRWCQAVYEDFPVGGEPACGWVAYRDALRAQEHGYKAMLPKVRKGDTVTLSTSGLTGTVFWAQDTRIGVGLGTEKDAAGYYKDKAWADISEVAIVNGVVVGGAPAPAPAVAEQGEPVFMPHDEAGAPLPWPYSAIDKLGLEDGLYAAYDAKGEFLLHLDNEGANEVFRLLPHVTLVPALPA